MSYDRLLKKKISLTLSFSLPTYIWLKIDELLEGHIMAAQNDPDVNKVVFTVMSLL